MTDKEFEQYAKEDIVGYLDNRGFKAVWNRISDDVQYIDTNASIDDIVAEFLQVKILDDYRCIITYSREDGMQDVNVSVLCGGQR